MLMKTQDRVLD